MNHVPSVFDTIYTDYGTKHKCTDAVGGSIACTGLHAGAAEQVESGATCVSAGFCE